MAYFGLRVANDRLFVGILQNNVVLLPDWWFLLI
jgi:hypothetical protein